MSRISRELMFMKMARILSERSTCSHLKVGAVLAIDSRVISTGYNGSPSGMPHCDDVGCEDENGACIRTVHAEANVIAFAAKHGISTDGSTLYTTHSPCYACAKLIVNAGIKKVVYEDEYRIVKGLTLLKACGIMVCQYLGEKK
jgi:dCMP deaminase